MLQMIELHQLGFYSRFVATPQWPSTMTPPQRPSTPARYFFSVADPLHATICVAYSTFRLHLFIIRPDFGQIILVTSRDIFFLFCSIERMTRKYCILYCTLKCPLRMRGLLEAISLTSCEYTKRSKDSVRFQFLFEIPCDVIPIVF